LAGARHAAIRQPLRSRIGAARPQIRPLREKGSRRLCDDQSAWIGDTHTKVGRLGAAHNLYTSLPRALAAYLTLCNGRLGAAECFAHGIANKVVRATG